VKGPLGGLQLDLRPGGDLGRVKRIGLIAGGTGISPMLQLLRMTWVHNLTVPIRLLYAAACPEQLAYLPWLRRKSRMHPTFEMHCTVDTVPSDTPWDEVRPPGGGMTARTDRHVAACFPCTSRNALSALTPPPPPRSTWAL
jgi:NAD(P)H-flavin reductase